MTDETAARNAVLGQVQDGTLSVEAISRALSDEASLRPLIMLRTIAQGDALTALNKVIDQYKVKLAEAHKVEDEGRLEPMTQDSRNRIAEYQAQITDLAHTPLDRALNAAQRAAAQETAGMTGLDPSKRKAYIDQRVNEAQAKYDADRAKAQHDFVQDQQDSIDLTMREIALVGTNDNYRTVELDKLKQEQVIRRQFPDMSAAEVQQRVMLVALQDHFNAQLKVTSAAWSEIRGEGDKFADDVLNPDNWTSWGNIAKTVLKDIEDEFIKLVALNPLKNMINGNSDLPTLGSLFKALGGGNPDNGGGGKYEAGISSNIIDNLPHNATGTESWSGGMTWVNENGPEIADLPNGTRIYPAAESRRMMSNDNAAWGSSHVSIGLNDEMLTAKIIPIADARIGAAAPAIANGAASMANARYDQKRRRRMR